MAHDAEMMVSPPSAESRARSAAAKRMRRHRERRQEGLRCLMIELREAEIDALIGMKLLRAEMRNDPSAVSDALYAYFESDIGCNTVTRNWKQRSWRVRHLFRQRRPRMTFVRGKNSLLSDVG